MDIFKHIFDSIKIPELSNTPISISGVHPAGQPFISVLFQKKYPDYNILIVVDDEKHQENFNSDMSTLLKFFYSDASRKNQQSVEPLFFAEWGILPDDGRLPNIDSLNDRLQTLIILTAKDSESFKPSTSKNEITKYGGKIIIASAVSLIQKTISPTILKQWTLNLKVGDKYGPFWLIEHFLNCAYEQEVKVTQKGEFSHRGGIIDIFPLTSQLPVRFEFFGDELDSIRLFDPITQVSQKTIDSVVIPPAGEYGLLKKMFTAGFDAKGERSNLDQKYTLESASTLLDFLEENTIIILCEPEKLKERVDSYLSHTINDAPLFVRWDDFTQTAISRQMKLLELQEKNEGCIEIQDKSEDIMPKLPDAILNNQTSDVEQISPHNLLVDSLEFWRQISDTDIDYQVADTNRRLFCQQIQNWLKSGYTAIIFCPQESHIKRVKEIWEEYGLDEKWIKNQENKKEGGRFCFYQGALSRGFIIEDAKIVVITDAEIFGRLRYLRPRRLNSKYIAGSTLPPLDITELEEGDYVVHINYGIGRFLGLERIKVSEQVKSDKEGQECLLIEYAPSKKGQSPPRLYVPVNEAHLVTKYIGTSKGRPPLNKLSGKKWQKDKEKAKNAIRDLAAELLSLQAERLSSSGFAFSSDTTWQHDFENSFEFEETPDQIQAILDTKADMESAKPMDRLICGDVGYGKTEVALRAAFKAVMSGKQVAILVPTTVLAQQHYNTFRTRMSPYPINIGLLSRFKTKGKQRNVIKGLSSGSIDIVIGTHRLLQDDVVFHDLGLVIIDEEQRFGVLHKEKLKLIKRKVDVLTLTATPIPRTLYMALTGARDMSIIQTPPHDRLPIETVVSKYDEDLIRNAILKELNRGGQVYFLHNQIYDIDNVAKRLKSIVPEARIVVAHGRMRPHILEDAMNKFIDREADVLLSTTIVENGLDIPNANTIIINRAEKFGLSDLYQLRGRIGRYKHQAYAFLLLPKHIELLSDARKRISAIKQYSSLGSGFKIAMRDLEIRGAGNILGVEQSGHIAAIGFHLYCQLLENEIKSIKGEKIKSLPTVSFHLDFIALSPAEEIQQPGSIKKSRIKKGKPIFVPRDVAYYYDKNEEVKDEDTIIIKAPAYIPSSYISDYGQRAEIYRKIGTANSVEDLAQVEKEIQDRFGGLPEPVKCYLTIAELKILAAEKGITLIETKAEKLILLRNNDYIMLNSKFPRLTKTKPVAKLKEIKVLLKIL